MAPTIVVQSPVSDPPFESALQLAGRGWAVLPLHTIRDAKCTCARRQCESAGKHPRTREGVWNATTDPSKIRRWLEKWPDSNIGIATGKTSGFDVLDVDPRRNGDETLRSLVVSHAELPETVAVKTGGAGLHLFFRHDPRVRNRTIAPGLDVKTTGGFVVAAGSLHISGQRYTWEGAGHPDEASIAPWPEWLLQIVTNRAKSALQSGQGPNTHRFLPGERNNRLTSLAGSLRGLGLEPEEIGAALQEINLRRCNPPLDRNEVSRISTGMKRYQTRFGECGRVTPEGYASAMDAILDLIRFGTIFSVSEFLVLLLHAERTIMFGKVFDGISISQVTSGLYSTRRGQWIRKGCGLGRSTAIRARQTLIDRGLLVAQKQFGSDGSCDPTMFAMDWDKLRSYFDELRNMPPPAGGIPCP